MFYLYGFGPNRAYGTIRDEKPRTLASQFSGRASSRRDSHDWVEFGSTAD
jgi:hypothetical protein